jgi:hypothetical protein
MLPNEVGNLLNAVAGGGSTAIDANRLRDELTGMADFHREMIGNNLLSPALSDLYGKHIGKYTGQTALTAPKSGAPEVVLMLQPVTYGVALVPKYEVAQVECPNCHQKFTP